MRHDRMPVGWRNDGVSPSRPVRPTAAHDPMREATRLTRQGRLTEATALIQSTLRGRGAPGSGGPDERRGAPGGRDDRGGPPAASRVRRADTTASGRGRPRTGSFTNQAGTRQYALHVPSAPPTGSMPLIVMLHGCSQSTDDFATGTRMHALAERAGALVVYPQQSGGANPSGCWNWFRDGDQRRDGGEPSIIAGITREVAATQPVDDRRVYVAGMSAGAAMAVIMGVTHPDLYAAVGAHSGLAYGAARDLASALGAMKRPTAPPDMTDRAAAPSAGAPSPGVPTIVFHGDADQTVDGRNGAHILARWAAHGREHGQAPATQHGRVPGGHAYTRVVYRDAHAVAVAEGWTVHGMGHAWSGGDPAGSYTDPRGPDASAEMLRFFADHRLGG